MEQKLFNNKVKEIVNSFNETFRECTVKEGYEIIAFAMSMTIKQDIEIVVDKDGVMSVASQLNMLNKFTDMIKEDIFLLNKLK